MKCNQIVKIRPGILSNEHFIIKLKSSDKLSIKINTNIENEKNKIFLYKPQKW